jgi:hypothetical protein
VVKTLLVIPGRRVSGEPGIQAAWQDRIAVWIPGSREGARPGMTIAYGR